MSSQPVPKKRRVSNGAKLVIIVLSFFLALTFVRAFTIEANSNEVIFSGNAPVKFPLAVTNTSNASMSLKFVADGPFSIIVPPNAPASIAKRDSKTVDLQLIPSQSFSMGDVYSAQIRVVSSAGEKSFPLTLRMKNPPLFNSHTPTGLFSFASFTSLPFFSSLGWVDALLIVIVVILGIALVARIKNRVIGGN
ncbi:MAG: hypothetical protein FJY86_01860 [Candidatus Diapherotrites archaeon]|uniref:Uncharacterized protein n=1 Tax=Candidatus Iainarchaeum sp. TaxID=3101447 RepID=A0A8T4CAU8_9ARCH|nr:hypothetical protein [Candidatus Diapherotrites archaeon]